MRQKIGIISGAGAIVGANFYKNLITSYALSSLQKDSSFPHVQLINFPFHSMDETGLIDRDLFKKEINYCFERLNDCNHIVVLCFSMHKDIKEIIGYVNYKKLYTIDCIIDEINCEPEKTLMLCSQTSRDEKIFNQNFHYLNDEEYIILNKSIENAIGANFDNWNLNTILDLKIKELNIDKIILGCTELFYFNFDLPKVEIINPEKLIIDNLKEKTK